MATEVGSDIALIQDEDKLRKMWQQTEDFGKKKEIRMRMYKLREQRLKEFYTTGEMIQTETTSKRSSTRTHTESITDQGYMAMKTKEIRDSESPTNEYQRQSNTKHYYASSKTDESDGNRGIVQIEHTNSIKPSEDFSRNSSQNSTSISSSTASKWESSQTIVSVSEVQTTDVNMSSKFIANEQNNEENQLTYDSSFNKQNNSNIDSKVTESITSSNVDDIKQEDGIQYSNGQQKIIKTYTNTSNENTFEPVSEVSNKNSTYADNTYTSDVSNKINTYVDNTYTSDISNKSSTYEDNKYTSDVSNKNNTYVDNEYTSDISSKDSTYVDNKYTSDKSNKDSTYVDNTHTSDVSTKNLERVEKIADSKIINELQKLDSYLSTQQSTVDSSSKANSIVSNEEKIIIKVDDKTTDTSKEYIEGQYTTTYQQAYQQPRISVEVSPSHEAFARSLRSTPERSSPSPNRERTSPDRRLKSASPEKYRASPEKSSSPPKSFKSATRRKLSSTQTKDLSKKRSNTPTRGEKYDSSDDSDCSGATHGTYDKYKGYDAKRNLFKEETKITSSTKFSHKSPSTSPVRREKSPGYSSEGSVGKEVKKSSSKIKHITHDSSPERSAFKPVKNYRAPQTQHVTQENKINLKEEENVYSNNNMFENNGNNANNLVKVIKYETEEDVNINENTINTTLNLKENSVQEKFIVKEQVCTSSEEVDNVKTNKKYNTEINKTTRENSPSKTFKETNELNYNETTTEESNTEINKKNREKSPSKALKQENKSNQEQFIENEKINIINESIEVNNKTVKPKEKSPAKEVKPVAKDTTKYPTIKSPEKLAQPTNNKSTTSTNPKKTTTAIPSSIKKVPSSLEKTPSKKDIIHKDSKDNLVPHKTVKKDLSREKVDIKIARTDSKTLIHKNSKENITPKSVVKKPSQEFLVDKKTTISYRNKVNSPETKPKIQDSGKVIEKKDSKTKLKLTISPQSSQKKFGIVKSSTETKTVTDYKRSSENTNLKKPATSVIKQRTYTPTKSTETPSKVTKTYLKTNTISYTNKTLNKKTNPINTNKAIKVEATKNVALKSNDLEDELPPDNFESDMDLDVSTEKPKYKHDSSDSSSSSSSEDENEEDNEKIKELDYIRIEAEEEYGKKMTNKDALLKNIVIQLPPSSRESSPDYSTRFGQPMSVSDNASLPRYADVVSEPEDVNDYRLDSNRYDIVTDLDEESHGTVADKVSKFLNNVNKPEEIKTTEIPQSPRAVKKAKQLFESIAKGQVEETDLYDDANETINTEVHESSKNINTQSSLLTRKISGASDYKSRKEFFENRKSNDTPEKLKHLTPKNITRSSSIKDRRASFETKTDKKTPLQDKTNVPRTRSPELKNSSPDRSTKSPSKTIKTETFDVKVEEVQNKSRRLSGSKTVKDRTATFEKNEIAPKSAKENKTTGYRNPVPSSSINTGRISETRTKSATVNDTTNISEHVSIKRETSPSMSKNSPEKTTVTGSTVNKVSETSSRKLSSKSPDRKITDSPDRKTAKSPERKKLTNTREDTVENRRVPDTTASSKQRTITEKTEFVVTTKSTSAPKSTSTTTKSISINVNDDEVQIEEIFDLDLLEAMLEKAVGYDRRRRIRAQIRIVKRQLETKNEKETNTTARVSKNARAVSPVKSHKQSNVVTEKSEYVKKTEVKTQRSTSPQKSNVKHSRSPSPQKTLRSVEETRSPLPQKTVRPTEKVRSPSPQKTTTPVEKARSPSPQKSTPTEKARSPSPKKLSVVKQQQESILNRSEKFLRNSTTSSTSTTVTTTTKVKSEQVSKSVLQEQNVTDLITSSYGVGPTDDNGRPLFGLRALRKTNTNQSINSNESPSSRQVDSYDSVSDHKGKPFFGLKALQSEHTGTVHESKTVYQTKVSEQKGGVDQLITDHKGKPLFGLRALQSIGKNEEEPIYDDMPEPPVSPQLKELVLKHEKHAKESSKLDAQPRQKPRAKFRDSFILDTKDEGLYSTFEQNGFSDPNSITLRSIIKKPEDDQSNETIIKSKSQSSVFQSKSVMRSDGSGNVSVTQDFLKGEVSSVNDQEPSGKVTRGRYTYQSPDDSDAKKGIAKVTTVTAAIGGNSPGPEITEVTEFDNSDCADGNKVVKRNRTNDKFESIQKRFSQESFDQNNSRRSSRETNGYEKTEESSQSTPRSSLVRGDSIKALQHKFQQATVSSSLKQNKTVKSDSSIVTRQVEERTVNSNVNSSKKTGATSFLDNNSRVTGVQDVLTRMRNADLVVESGDTDEDIEARALLNKFLGASVILHGMEQGGKSLTSSSPTTTTSASLVNQVEKQRAQNSPVIRTNLNEQDLDNIWDEKQLQILLESCPDYDQRRKIRARLRQIMAEQKACADVVALANNADGTGNGETNEVTESKSTSVSTKTEGGSYVKTEVHTRTTTSSNRLTKANSVSSSPFAKFQQLERQNSAPNSQSRPSYKFTDPALARSASTIKDRLLNWVKAQTKEYKDLQITNFSTSWSDGLAFCALIHHFYPEAFDYYKLKPENRRENFEIAFKVAEDEAGIAPLLDVEDMVVMRKPDWKCVFTYVQTFYRRFHNDPQAVKPSYFE